MVATWPPGTVSGPSQEEAKVLSAGGRLAIDGRLADHCPAWVLWVLLSLLIISIAASVTLPLLSSSWGTSRIFPWLIEAAWVFYFLHSEGQQWKTNPFFFFFKLKRRTMTVLCRNCQFLILLELFHSQGLKCQLCAVFIDSWIKSQGRTKYV